MAVLRRYFLLFFILTLVIVSFFRVKEIVAEWTVALDVPISTISVNSVCFGSTGWQSTSTASSDTTSVQPCDNSPVDIILSCQNNTQNGALTLVYKNPSGNVTQYPAGQNNINPPSINIATGPKTVELYCKDAVGNIGFKVIETFQQSATAPTNTPTPTGPTPTSLPTPVQTACPADPGGAWSSNAACGDSAYNTLTGFTPPHNGLPSACNTVYNGSWLYAGSSSQYTASQVTGFNSWCAAQDPQRNYCYVCNIPPTPTSVPPTPTSSANTPTPQPTVNPGSGNQSYSGPLMWGYVYKDTDNNKQFTPGTDVQLGIAENPDALPSVQGKWIGNGTTYTVTGSSPNVLRSAPTYRWTYCSPYGCGLNAGYTHTISYGGMGAATTNAIFPLPDIPYTYTTRGCNGAYICNSYLERERTAVSGFRGVYKDRVHDYYWESTSGGSTTLNNSDRTDYKFTLVTGDCAGGCTIQAPPQYNQITFANSQTGFNLYQGRYCSTGASACTPGGTAPGSFSDCKTVSQCSQTPPNPNCISPAYYCVNATPVYYDATTPVDALHGWTIFGGSDIYRSNQAWHDWFTAYGFKPTGTGSITITYPGPKIQNPKNGNMLGQQASDLFDNTMTNFCNSPCSCTNDDQGGGSGFTCIFPPRDPDMNVSPPGDYYFTLTANQPSASFTFTASYGATQITSQTATPTAGRLNFYFTVPQATLGSKIDLTLTTSYSATPITLGAPELYPLGVYEANVSIPRALTQTSYCMNNFNNIGVNTPISNAPLAWSKQLGNQYFYGGGKSCALSVLGNQVYYNYPHGAGNATDTLQTDISKNEIVRNDFLLGRPNTVRGNIFLDNNKNYRLDATETKYTNPPNTNAAYTLNAKQGSSTIQTYTCIPGDPLKPCDGSYVFYLLDGSYTIEYASLPSGYIMTWPLTASPAIYTVTVGSTCTYNPTHPNLTTTSAGIVGGVCTIDNLNFGITNEINWIQGRGGDMRLDRGFTKSPVPTALNTYASLEWTAGNAGPGLIFSGDGTYNFCPGSITGQCKSKASATQWIVGGPSYPEVFRSTGQHLAFSYSGIFSKVQQNGFGANSLGCPALPATSCSLNINSITKGIWINQITGTQTLNMGNPAGGQSNINGGAYVILVRGDVHIRGSITVSPNSSLIVAATGNIYVDGNVGQASSATCDISTGNNCTVMGFWSAEGNFIIDEDTTNKTLSNPCQASGAPWDKRVNIRGMIVANAARSASGDFLNRRDLCIDTLSYPTVYIEEAPEQILFLPEFIKRTNYYGQEDAP